MAKLRRLREHYYSWKEPVPVKRYMMDALEYSGFPSSDDRDIFIKRQLENRGFDLTKTIEQYRGVTNNKVLFEQLTTGGDTL